MKGGENNNFRTMAEGFIVIIIIFMKHKRETCKTYGNESHISQQEMLEYMTELEHYQTPFTQ